MINYIISHQLNYLMVFGGICGFIFIFFVFMRIEDLNKKKAFLQISFFAMVLLFSDRYAYIYRGNTSTLGYWMVRISNFLVFASIILTEDGFTNYLLSFNEIFEADKCSSKILKIARVFAIIGLVILVISQFTGFYYTFDDMNRYQRNSGFAVCYSMPILITVLQIVFILKNRKKFSKTLLTSFYFFVGLPLVASLIQFFIYGISLTTIFIAVSAIIVYLCALAEQNNVLLEAADKELNRVKEMQEKTNELLYQTVEALASAVDAKDAYTHGHSARVAKYSREIAELAGMNAEECENVYLAGLLHDVGKIGIKDSIINKEGRLTDEEFATIKQHPVLGEQILSKIVLSSTLSVGAHYHHERYDGSGYPERLKGEDIPEIARIIAVADAYDAMTSKRSYRNQIPQQQVREEIVKGIGTQFDPKYAKMMIHMIDVDQEYTMKENQTEDALGAALRFEFKEFKELVTPGIRITECPVNIMIKVTAAKDGGFPTFLFYDSSDARYYATESQIMKDMDFVEYASIGFDGTVTEGYIRKMQKNSVAKSVELKSNKNSYEASIMIVKQEDHFQVILEKEDCVDTFIFALNDASRYLYLAITGKDCTLELLEVNVSEDAAEEGFIQRIADRISYIEGPTGDIPNVQIDGWRANHSEAIELIGSTSVTFHTMSLPSSRRIWHCPIICIFTSDDGKIGGENYKEIALLRLDGEAWSEVKEIVNSTITSKDESFENWNVWKQKNREGLYCKLSLLHKGNIIKLKAEDGGMTTINQTTLPERLDKAYFFITGDQCALTDIRISRA